MNKSKIANFFSFIIAVPAIYLASISSAQANNTISGTIDREYNLTVRYENFTVREAGITTIDVNAFGMNFGNGKSQLNSHIYLFQDDGWLDETDLIAQSNMFDQKIASDNSPTRFDPYLSEYLEEGNYVLAISGDEFTLEESFAEENNSTSFGDYQIKFSDNVFVNDFSTEKDKEEKLLFPKSPILEESISTVPQTIAITKSESLPAMETTYTNKLTFTPEENSSSTKISDKASVPEPSFILGLLAISALKFASMIKGKKK